MPVRPSLVAHCDWSTSARKRWMCIASRVGETWKLAPPEPVGDGGDLLARLRARAGDGVLVGFDFPIGLPAAYAERTGLGDFRGALRQFGKGEWSDWYRVCGTPEEIGIARPFYPMRPGGSSRRHLLEGMGLGAFDDLLRACDRATADRRAASPLFWTLGSQQVGKAAIAGWQEIIVPNLGAIGLWPFAGSLSGLLARHRVVVAETYPRDGYGQIGIPRELRWSKRDPDGRRRAAEHLVGWIKAGSVETATELMKQVVEGFADDDRFDAFVGLAAMLDVVDGRRAEGAPEDEAILKWEGWILGQAASPSLPSPSSDRP